MILALGCGTAVRLTVRDSYLWTGLIYYVTSPAAMCLLVLGGLLMAPARLRGRRRLLLLCLPLVAGWAWRSQYVGNATLPLPATTFRLMLWNACDGQLGWSRIEAVIRDARPGILALAEAETLKTRSAAWFQQHYPGYQRLDLPRRLMLLSRYPILGHRRLAWIKGGNYEAVEVAVAGQRVTILFCDFASDLLSHRRRHIEKLHEVLQTLHGPVMFVGDLNTPVDSRYFDPIREEFHSAFETSGQGLHTTWPMPLPVIAIDHLWGSRQIAFHRTQILWTTCSDHRPVITDFTVAADRPTETEAAR
ncbi:MAG: hypothetical protein NXI04_04580 [Planctomycetaceae bacterium]|nr:hypothetical protein [Planctomycetaceae bacterium]